ncbi:hypothetical protein JCM1840_000309 [Sporobolomyces johnsonii]
MIDSSAAAKVNYISNRYGYLPSIVMASVFLTLFFLSMILHLVQLVKFRRYWFMGSMVVGCALEAVGWSLRLYGHKHVASRSPYIAELTLLVIAPTFFSAALYWALGVIFALVAPTKSFLPTKWFKIVFISSDFAALVIQAVGGGMAGAAGDDTKKLNTDSKVMLAGIALQLAVMTIYVAYGIYWTCRARRQVKLAGTKMQVMLGAMLLASCALIIRNGFRTAELHQGFRGKLAEKQLMMLFDGVPIAFATCLLNIIHPHWFLVTAPTVPPVADDEKATNASTTEVPAQPTNPASQESVKLPTNPASQESVKL